MIYGYTFKKNMNLVGNLSNKNWSNDSNAGLLCQNINKLFNGILFSFNNWQKPEFDLSKKGRVDNIKSYQNKW